MHRSVSDYLTKLCFYLPARYSETVDETFEAIIVVEP